MHSKPKCNKVREPNPNQGVNVAAAMLGTRKIWELTRLTNKMAKRMEPENGEINGTTKEQAT